MMFEPPDSPPNVNPAVPYAAYRPKRHSRNVSNNSTPKLFAPNVSPPPSLAKSPPNSRPSSMHLAPSETESLTGFGELSGRNPKDDAEKANGLPNGTGIESSTEGKAKEKEPEGISQSLAPLDPPPTVIISPSPSLSEASTSNLSKAGPSNASDSSSHQSSSSTSSSSAVPSASTSSTPPPTLRKVSTFRRVPRNSNTPLPGSPLARDAQSHSRTISLNSAGRPNSMMAVSSQKPSHERNRLSTSLLPTTNSALISPTRSEFGTPPKHAQTLPYPVRDPLPQRTSSLQAPSPSQTPHSTGSTITSPPASVSSSGFPFPGPSPVPSPGNSTATSPGASSLDHPTSRPPSSLSHSTNTRTPAPYRPGFQPKGVYRPRTDEFLSARRVARDGATDSGTQKRVERTKVERRLEKLIALHFPEHGHEKTGEGELSLTGNGKEKYSSVGAKIPAHLRPEMRTRRTSFFDINELRRMSSSFLSGSGSGDKEDIRSLEQRITPWTPDSDVLKCPMCQASFHPLSNRKHHCRLCGKVVCALLPKKPHRPTPCSLLFVVDPKTRQIEEVAEGVDYGVRKRKSSSVDLSKNSTLKNANGKAVAEEEEEEKFLKGVRICRECKPVLMRQQYLREREVVPSFVRLYEAFVMLEKEIEESLPQFEELLLSLNKETDEPLTATAAAERKRLLQSFTAYDVLAKRIRTLPCPRGSSQDRVQAAVAVRAARFLEVRMVGLGALPKKEKAKSQPEKEKQAESALGIDPDSALAHSLQPLLEQEALLEQYVTEATAARKFEDAKILRGNLKEIRVEIQRVVKEGQGGTVR